MDLNNVIQAVTFVLGLVGSAGTFWTFMQTRKKLTMNLTGNTVVRQHGSSYLVVVQTMFINHSTLPITVTDVILQIGTQKYACLKGSQVPALLSREKLIMLSDINAYLTPCPLQLMGLGGVSAYLAFLFSTEEGLPFSTPATFQISTNRGKVIQIQLELHPSTHLQ